MLGLLKLHQIISKPAFILTIPSTPHPSPPNSLSRTHWQRRWALPNSPNTPGLCPAGSDCDGPVVLPYKNTICESNWPVPISAALIPSKYRQPNRLHGLVCKHVSIKPAAEYSITHFNTKRKPFWIWRDPAVPAGMIQISIGMDFTRDN